MNNLLRTVIWMVLIAVAAVLGGVSGRYDRAHHSVLGLAVLVTYWVFVGLLAIGGYL